MAIATNARIPMAALVPFSNFIATSLEMAAYGGQSVVPSGRDLMGADPAKSESKLAVHTEQSVALLGPPFLTKVADEATTSIFLTVFCPTAIYMVDGKKSDLGLSATGTNATVGHDHLAFGLLPPLTPILWPESLAALRVVLLDLVGMALTPSALVLLGTFRTGGPPQALEFVAAGLFLWGIWGFPHSPQSTRVRIQPLG